MASQYNDIVKKIMTPPAPVIQHPDVLMDTFVKTPQLMTGILNMDMINNIRGVLPIKVMNDNGGNIKSMSFASVNWQIPSNGVVNSNACFNETKDLTQLKIDNYTYTPNSFLTIYQDGSMKIPAGTHDISFGCTKNYGPVLAYIVLKKDGTNQIRQYNSASSYNLTGGVCTATGLYWTFTWWNLVVYSDETIYFYIADMQNNSESIPLYKGTISFN